MSDTDATTLGRRLRDLRVHHDPYLKLRDVSRAMRTDPATWSHYEADRERPTRDTAARVPPIIAGDLGELLRLWEEWREAPPLDLSTNICRKVW